MAKATRPYQWREYRLVSEFIAETYPHAITMHRVRLGSINPKLVTPGMDKAARNMLVQYNRWADAVVITDDKLILIEATIPANPNKISQLKLYNTLLPTTPQLEEYIHLPVDLLLLMAVHDESVINFAESEGIKCAYFRPSWVDEYLKHRSRRYGAAFSGGN